jgi:glycosyltransferase involved in cell wall biosynthesis
MITTQGEIVADLLRAEGWPVIEFSSAPSRYRRLYEIVAGLIRHRREIDVVSLQVFGGPSFVVEDIASRIARRFHIPIVMVLHGGDFPNFVQRHEKWSRAVLERAAEITAPSPFLKRTMKQLGFRCEVIPNVLDLALYPYRHRTGLKPNLFWMRSFHPIYNPEMAVQVLARLRKDYPAATLTMGGQDKGLLGGVQTLAQSLGVADSVRFPGFLNADSKISQFEQSDIFLNTNRIDNMPVSVVEACAMGIPVVATDVGGLRDLLTDGETGLIVPDEDIDAMEAATRRLLRDRELAGRISANGRALADKSAWSAVKPQLEAVFQRAWTAKSC